LGGDVSCTYGVDIAVLAHKVVRRGRSRPAIAIFREKNISSTEGGHAVKSRRG
jgi:hypothetical protein